MKTISTTIAELRILIGYLGEKGQGNWWSSEFFSTTAAAFLAPIFNRSLFLAQYQGVIAAAAKVHDEAIGVGRIYHLFRLPIGLEQDSADALNDAAFVQTVQARLANRDLALARLVELAGTAELASSGPVSLGQMSQDAHYAINEDGSDYDDDVGGTVYVAGRDGVDLAPLAPAQDAIAKLAAQRLFKQIEQNVR